MPLILEGTLATNERAATKLANTDTKLQNQIQHSQFDFEIGLYTNFVAFEPVCDVSDTALVVYRTQIAPGYNFPWALYPEKYFPSDFIEETSGQYNGVSYITKLTARDPANAPDMIFGLVDDTHAAEHAPVTPILDEDGNSTGTYTVNYGVSRDVTVRRGTKWVLITRTQTNERGRPAGRLGNGFAGSDGVFWVDEGEAAPVAGQENYDGLKTLQINANMTHFGALNIFYDISSNMDETDKNDQTSYGPWVHYITDDMIRQQEYLIRTRQVP